MKCLNITLVPEFEMFLCTLKFEVDLIDFQGEDKEKKNVTNS